MAIVQISQITNRLGLQADLPQLAGAELGWSTDSRRLYIGNGTLEEGAPVIGNTEILTEFSDILNIADFYTYKGTAAGYVVQTGPTPGTPVVESLQNWMDQWASVKDFGATGDGLTDDTEAINRALYQLYCRESNIQIRRSLFFPAGKYIISSTINIPTYATLYGEGIDGSVIQMVASGGTGTYVAQTADSKQQTGANIGVGGATAPTGITISNMSFQSLDSTKNIFLVQTATNCRFTNVGFSGTETTLTIPTSLNDTVAVGFGSTPAVTTSDIIFDGCHLSGMIYGFNATAATSGVSVNNSNFNTLFQGVVLGVPGNSPAGPTGTRITNSIFDNIYSEGIMFHSTLNASGYNIFYNVGMSFNSTNPTTSIIAIENNNNVSIGDMFDRAFVPNYPPQVSVGNYNAIAITNGSTLALGSKKVNSGLTATLADNVITPTAAFTLDTDIAPSFKIDYSIVRYNTFRTGTLWISSATPLIFGNQVTFMDDYTENYTTGITISVTQVDNIISVNYTSAPSTGYAAEMNYSVSYF